MERRRKGETGEGGGVVPDGLPPRCSMEPGCSDGGRTSLAHEQRSGQTDIRKGRDIGESEGRGGVGGGPSCGSDIALDLGKPRNALQRIDNGFFVFSPPRERAGRSTAAVVGRRASEVWSAPADDETDDWAIEHDPDVLGRGKSVLAFSDADSGGEAVSGRAGDGFPSDAGASVCNVGEDVRRGTTESVVSGDGGVPRGIRNCVSHGTDGGITDARMRAIADAARGERVLGGTGRRGEVVGECLDEDEHAREELPRGPFSVGAGRSSPEITTTAFTVEGERERRSEGGLRDGGVHGARWFAEGRTSFPSSIGETDTRSDGSPRRIRGGCSGSGPACAGAPTGVAHDGPILGVPAVDGGASETSDGPAIGDGRENVGKRGRSSRMSMAVRGVIYAKGEGIFAMYDEPAAAVSLWDYGGEAPVLRAYGSGKGHLRDKKGTSGRKLPVPVVETVDLSRLIPWAARDASEVLRTVLSWDVFTTTVILQEERERGFVCDPRRRMAAGGARLRSLKGLRYLRPVRRVPAWGGTCEIFFCPKDDIWDRMIYNGRPINARCARPPNVGFVAVHDMLRRLTRPDVARYASYDFRSWFIQLKVSPEVQRVFCVQAMDGSLFRVSGLPMGWSWAPVIAQKVAQTIVDEALRRIADVRVGAFVYIDNVIFYLHDEEAADRRVERLDSVFREVCGEANAALKESATTIGVAADWLGVMVTAGRRQASFREGFVEKVRQVREVLEAHQTQEMRFLWRALALSVRALWVARRPLAEIADAMRWMSRAAVALNEGSARWETKARMWDAAHRQLVDVLRWIAEFSGAFTVWEPESEAIVAVGASDAAGGPQGAGGFLWRQENKVTAVRICGEGEQRRHINVMEAEAMESGLWAVLQVVPSGTIRWFGDNTVANAWAMRSWAPQAGRNACLKRRAALMRRRKVEVSVERVGGGSDNPADVLTRSSEAYAMLAPGVSWTRQFDVECACEGLCDHVRAGLLKIVQGPGP